MKRLAIGWLVACLGLPAFSQGVDLGTEAQRANGKKLYDKFCSQCHGENGDGEGIAYPFVRPKPRDFTSGKYKIRRTPNGQLPLHDDIVNILKRGMPYSTMPAWPRLSESQLDDVTYYLKSFSPDFADPNQVPESIPVGKAPAASEESIARGREIYELQGCAQCHGELGRGDGTSAPTLVDDWGFHIPSADLTKRWTFRGGAKVEDIYRTLSTGLNGTPMPSYYDAVSDEDRWNLAHYVASLSPAEEPPYKNLVIADAVDEIDLSDLEKTFGGAEPAMFPTVGQIVQVGRNFSPYVTAVTVDAAYDDDEIAIRVRWNDLRADTVGTNDPAIEVERFDPEAWLAAQGAAGAGDAGDDPFAEGGDPFGDLEADPFAADEVDPFAADEADPFAADAGDATSAASGVGAPSAWSDAVAVQFPMSMPTGIAKPYFIFGDSSYPVDLWYVDLGGDGTVKQYVGKGSKDLVAEPGSEFEAVWNYDQGEWSVIFTRPRSSDRAITFAEEQYVPIAVSVWDGFNDERGGKRNLTQWMYLYTEPSVIQSARGPMAKAFAATLGIELLLVGWIAWRHGRKKTKETVVAPARADA